MKIPANRKTIPPRERLSEIIDYDPISGKLYRKKGSSVGTEACTSNKHGYLVTHKIDAISARENAELKFGYHPNHGRHRTNHEKIMRGA